MFEFRPPNFKTHLGQKVVKHEDVERAMRSVDRGFYCPSNAYFDAPESIGYGATISAPHMVR